MAPGGSLMAPEAVLGSSHFALFSSTVTVRGAVLVQGDSVAFELTARNVMAGLELEGTSITGADEEFHAATSVLIAADIFASPVVSS